MHRDKNIVASNHYRRQNWGMRTLTCSLLLLIPGFGCGSPGTLAPKAEVQILCTTEMLAGPMRTLCGPHADVTSLMGAGVDPHLYKPSPGDVQRILDADLVLFHGHHLEGRMGEILGGHGGEHREASNRRFIAICERIDDQRLIRSSAGTIDPHLWMDISLWQDVIEQMELVLSELDPDHREYFRSAAATLDEELELLDEQVMQMLAMIPEKRRILVTAHDAFGYFGRRYRLEVMGIQGISTESEASIDRVNTLVATLSERNVPAVFVESTVPERNIRALIEGCSSLGHSLEIGGVLFSDAPGPEGSGAARWRDMVLHDARVISEALR